MTRRPVLAYLRVSVVGDRAATGRLESPELQRLEIDGWCERNDAEVVDEIRDLNRSGGTLTRPGLERALETLRRGEAEGIVVARLDRASRVTLDGLGLIERLERAGLWIVAADGSIDTTTRLGRMATTMNLAMAQTELERYREQSAVIHRRAIVEKGRQMGPAPFGYRRGEDRRLELDPVAAGWARRIFAWRADGFGWVRIARLLEESGVRSATGRRINQKQIQRMVGSRVYVGEATHGAHVRPDSHPALVDEASWAAAQRSRPAVGTAPARRVHVESLLRGLLRCAGCRYVLKRQPMRTGDGFAWVCRARLAERAATHDCSAQVRVAGRAAATLEEAVVAEFMALASGTAARRDEAAADVTALERALGEAEALLDEVGSLEVRRTLGADRWRKMGEEARVRADAARQELAKATVRGAAVGVADEATLRRAWDGMDLAERQDALRSIVQAVMVAEDGSFVVVPTWEAADLPRRGVRGFVARPWD